MPQLTHSMRLRKGKQEILMPYVKEGTPDASPRGRGVCSMPLDGLPPTTTEVDATLSNYVLRAFISC